MAPILTQSCYFKARHSRGVVFITLRKARFKLEGEGKPASSEMLMIFSSVECSRLAVMRTRSSVR